MFLFCLFSFSIVGLSYSASVRKEYFAEMNAFFDEPDYDVFDDEDFVPQIDTKLVAQTKDSNERILKGNNCEYISICDITANSQCSDGNKFVIKKANGTRKQFLILDSKPVLGFVTRGKKFKDCTEYTEVTTDVTCKEVSGLDDVSLESTSATSSNASEALNATITESADPTDSSNATESLETTPSSNTTSANATTSSDNATTSSNSTLRSFEEILVINREVEVTTKISEGRVIKGDHCDYISICDITENSGCSNGYKFVIKRASKQVRKQFLILNGKSVLGFVTKGEKFANCSSYTEVTSSVTCKEVAGLGSVDLSAASNSSSENTSSNEAVSTTVSTSSNTEMPPNSSESSISSTTPTTTNNTSNSTNGCKCGVKKGSRIVGGTETTVNEYPWMTAIVSASGESQFCGGTLIASQWVLTAAHCMFKDSQGQNPQTAAEIKALLGEHNLASTGEETIPRKLVTVTQIINHASYDATSSNYDIALLKLSEKVDLNVYTPACLAKSADNFEGKNAWVYGWGTTSFGGASADSLMEVEVPVVSNSVCTAAMGNGITDQMLCAGGQLNKDGCQGDSGGPLTVDSNGQHVLIGDVSFGDGCGQAGKYGVYGDVANLRTWVDEQMTNNGGSEFCPAGADAA